MKIFDKPNNFNGAELKEELSAVGIVVEEIFDFADGTIGFETNNESKAKEIVEAHNGSTVARKSTIEDKLASVGLNLIDLKTALGL